MKIKLSIVTEMEFDNEEDFYKYVVSDEVALITGFKTEITEAFLEIKPVKIRTPRPRYGAVTTSIVKVDKYE